MFSPRNQRKPQNPPRLDPAEMARLLREESLQARPEFDEKLHARIMEAVDPWRPGGERATAERAATGGAHPVPGTRRGIRHFVPGRLVAGLAAAAALLVLAGFFRHGTDADRPRIERIAAVESPVRVPPPAERAEWSAAARQLEAAEFAAAGNGLPATGTPHLMALAVTDPLKGWSVRTSKLPVAAAARLGRLNEANSRYAASLVRDRWTDLDQEARLAAGMLFDTLGLRAGPRTVSPGPLLDPVPAEALPFDPARTP